MIKCCLYRVLALFSPAHAQQFNSDHPVECWQCCSSGNRCFLFGKVTSGLCCWKGYDLRQCADIKHCQVKPHTHTLILTPFYVMYSRYGVAFIDDHRVALYD